VSLPRPEGFEFFERIRCLCALYSASVTSWGRTDARNKMVGGGEASYHRIRRGMLAVDLVLDDMTQSKLLVEAGRKLGLDMIDEGDHVHAEPTG